MTAGEASRTTAAQFASEGTNRLMAIEAVDQDPKHRWLTTRPSGVWSPPTDVFEADGLLIVLVEIPGMLEHQFNVTLQERRLTIDGLRRRPVHDPRAYQQMEIRYGDFHVEAVLPWLVDAAQVHAVYRDGFLSVELPRAKNQQIQVVNVEQDAR